MNEDLIPDLAQKLYEEDGHAGNVYKQDAHLLRKYENQAIEILEGEDNDSQTNQ
jgi:hypothetical protein